MIDNRYDYSVDINVYSASSLLLKKSETELQGFGTWMRFRSDDQVLA